MGAGVTNDLDAFLVFGSNDGNGCIVIHKITCIVSYSVNFAGNTVTGQTWTYALCDFKDGYRTIKGFDVTVRKSNFRHK